MKKQQTAILRKIEPSCLHDGDLRTVLIHYFRCSRRKVLRKNTSFDDSFLGCIKENISNKLVNRSRLEEISIFVHSEF